MKQRAQTVAHGPTWLIWSLALAGFLVALGLRTSALAGDAAGDPAAGKQVALKWCGACHVVTDNQPFRSGRGRSAPTFAAIAASPTKDDGYIRQYLNPLHLPMPTCCLSDTEERDLLAFLDQLRKQER